MENEWKINMFFLNRWLKVIQNLYMPNFCYILNNNYIFPCLLAKCNQWCSDVDIFKAGEAGEPSCVSMTTLHLASKLLFMQRQRQRVWCPVPICWWFKTAGSGDAVFNFTVFKPPQAMCLPCVYIFVYNGTQDVDASQQWHEPCYVLNWNGVIWKVQNRIKMRALLL